MDNERFHVAPSLLPGQHRLGPTSGGMTDDVFMPGPLLLQDHFHPEAKTTPMRFRSIWYRPLD